MNDQQRAAMQMALGAMLTAQNILIFKCGGDMRPMERETIDDLVEAITSVQIALAQPQVMLCCPNCNSAVPSGVSIKEAQPQGEWVDLTDYEIIAAVVKSNGFHPCSVEIADIRSAIAKFKSKNTPPVVQQGEPVAHYKDATHTIYLQTGCDDPEDCECSFNEWGDTTWCADQIHDTDIPYIRADYAAPVSAKREWVDLTDDEIYDALAEVRFVRDNLLDGCRALIAAFKEKNK